MASRESQGLQVALIIFVMITVVLAVMTFVFYRKGEQLNKTVADARGKEKTAKESYDTENFKVQYLKHILGASPLSEAELNLVTQSILGDPDMKGIDDLYQQHMSTYGEGLPNEKLNYRDVLPNLLMALRQRNVDNTALAAEVTKTNNEKAQLQASETKRTAEATANLQKARNDLDDRTQSFDKDRQALQQKQEDQLAKFDTARKGFQKKMAMDAKSISDRNTDLKKLENVVGDQRRTIEEMRDEPFEIPDGQVAWVNQRSSKVWINLGSADGLRRQTLFSIYAKEDNGVTRAEPKASVEITRVLDEHLSEARIVSDEPSDPVMPGDHVFSPAWRPGRRVHFALAGLLDIDGDRRSDRELVRSLILSSGAVIDAEVTATGEAKGELNASTRYLVRGAPPTDRNDAAALSAWSKINGDADQLGVEKITLDKLLSWMGYKSEVRTVPLGKGARAEDFKIGPAEGKARSSTGNVFRGFKDRKPPARGGGGTAF
ncbi:MAG: hypothetical protein ACC628_05145 [Pirellulaceae bacterium]